MDLLNDTITNMTTVEPDFSIRNRFKIDLFVIQKDYSYIKKYLLQKLKVTENKELILKDLAVLDFYFKNYNSSLKYFSKSNEIVDRNYVNYLYSGYIYFLKKSYNRAIEEAQKSIKLNKFSIFSYLLIVKSYLKINKIKDAKKYLAEIKENSDKTNYLTLMEVLILIKEGNNDLAKEKLKSVHNFFSNDYLVKQLLFKL
jgi:tetratricopeptide (TPR) repeat protein